MFVDRIKLQRVLLNLFLLLYTYIFEVFVGAINAQKTDHVVTVVMLGMVIPMYVCILSTSRKANNNGISFIYIIYILSVLFYFGQYVLIMIGCSDRLQGEYVSLLCGRVERQYIIKGMYVLSRSLLFLNLGYLVFLKKPRFNIEKKNEEQISANCIEFYSGYALIARLLFIFSSIGMAISLAYDISVGSYGLRRMTETSVYTFSSGNPLFYAKYISQWFLPSIYMLMIYEVNKSKKKYRLLLGVLLVYSALYLISGSRFEIIKIVCAVVLLHTTFVNTIRVKDIIKYSPLVIVFGVVLSGISAVRSSSFTASSLAQYLITTGFKDLLYNILSETGLTAVSLSNTLQHCPSEVPHYYFMSLLKAFCSILPSFINPMYSEVTKSVSNVFSPYIFGSVRSGYGSAFVTEAYYYWGNMMYVVIMLYGCIIAEMKSVAEGVINKKNAYAIFSVIYMYSEMMYCIRTDVIGLFRTFVYCVILPYALMYIVGHRKMRIYQKMNLEE